MRLDDGMIQSYSQIDADSIMTVSFITALCVNIVLLYSVAAHSQNHFETNQLQRQQYLDAKAALKSGNVRDYRALKQQLAGYSLLPYLDYQELNKKLNTYPYSDVDRFLDAHQNTYLGSLLLRKWLSQLAASKRWQEYRSYFSAKLTSVTHRCLFIWSRLQTGDSSALKDVEPLWNVGKSQPDTCDAVFKQWQKAGYLTETLVWDRYVKASLRNNARLKRYLKRLMLANTRSLANDFQTLLNNPSLLEEIDDYGNDSPHMKSMVFHSLVKYVRTNPNNAWELWKDYDSLYGFSETQANEFIYKLAKRHAFDRQTRKAQKYLGKLTEEQSITVNELVIREELKKGDWREVDRWIAKLPEKQKLSERWQYWQARTFETLGKSKGLYLPIYESLAQTRSFYGFLSSDYLSQKYSLQNSPTIVQQETRKALESNPAILRARELFFLNKLNGARQEWAYATRNTETPLTPEAHQAAATLAFEWGWHRKSIESMAAASAWDDLSIRFPVAHETIIQQQAKQTNLPATLLFAIARQESAWETDARSSAGAMGLMQIMPRTAKETARKAGISHSRNDLFEPEHNIILGSRYISELLGKYDNNRVPAIAAYNAGPYRVNRWLKETDNQLPYDIWIEVIPFGETRKYVQNVLSYAVVYAYQTGAGSTLLTQVEINRPL
jgi:soluble lytic murein transglycosylase